jgi:hypothetical protein
MREEEGREEKKDGMRWQDKIRWGSADGREKESRRQERCEKHTDHQHR